MFSLGLTAQNKGEVAQNEVELIKMNFSEKNAKSKTKASNYSKIRAKVIRLNHKKSNDIISIKAYRKSLHIKVKTVILC